jgi:hypothetical protein
VSPRWTIAVAAVLSVLAAAAVLYWSGRHDGAARERPKAEAARAEAAVAKLETRGARETAQRVEVVVRQREAAAAVVAKLTPEALKSEDANAPLDPARAARLRDADRSLCLADPEFDGCPADRGPR